MAFRRPLKLNGSNLQEMSDSEIDDLRNVMFHEYIASPSVSLSVVGSGGNLGTLTDTRLQAGASSSSATDYPSEETTAEPSVVSVGYSRVSQSVTNTSPPNDVNSKSFPLYYDGNNIRTMSLQDMYDTFAFSVIDSLQSAFQVYRIHSGDISGWTKVSSTPVFSDTGANVSAYTSGGIPETLDQPFTRTNYYLLKRNYTPPALVRQMVFLDSNNNIQEEGSLIIRPLFRSIIVHVAAEVSGSRLRYSWNGTGNSCGSAIDTRLNGSGNYETRFVNANDYRAQEFPNGSLVTVNTYTLRVRQE